MYVRIGYRLLSLDMGTYCARICRLGAILGRGAGTSTIRINVFRVFRVRHTTHAVKMHYYDIALICRLGAHKSAWVLRVAPMH